MNTFNALLSMFRDFEEHEKGPRSRYEYMNADTDNPSAAAFEQLKNAREGFNAPAVRAARFGKYMADRPHLLRNLERSILESNSPAIRREFDKAAHAAIKKAFGKPFPGQ